MTARPCEACGSVEFRSLYSKEAHDFHRCRSCALIRIDPQPTDAVLASIYGTKYYDAWGVQSGADRVFALKKATFRQHVFSELPLAKGARILDCGAAFGALMEVARELGCEPYGIELAEEAAAGIATKFGADRVYSGPFEQAHFAGLGDGAFDAVFMCDFIEHVRDPRSVLEKAASLLRPGGHLVVTTPNGSSLSSRFMGGSWPHSKVEHLYFFDPHNLGLLLDRVGLTVERSRVAKKVLDLEYLRHQFNTYPRAVVTPVMNLVARCAGSAAKSPLSFSFGEMLLVARKSGVT